GDARLVVFEHVNLDQQAGAVLHDHVSGGEARNVLRHRKTFDRIGFAYADILPDDMAGISDRLLDVRLQNVTLPGGEGGIDVRANIDRISGVVLEVGAVGDVIVDEEIRQPFVEKL